MLSLIGPDRMTMTGGGLGWCVSVLVHEWNTVAPVWLRVVWLGTMAGLADRARLVSTMMTLVLMVLVLSMILTGGVKLMNELLRLVCTFYSLPLSDLLWRLMSRNWSSRRRAVEMSNRIVSR